MEYGKKTVIALEDGRVAKCGEKHEVLSDLSLIEKGIDLPQTVLLADELRKMGIPIKEKLITKQEMIWQLKQMMEK